MPKPPATNPYSIDDPKSDRLLVRQTDNYIVLPLQEAINSAGFNGSFLPRGGVTRGYAIAILPLEFIGAAEMERILRPLSKSDAVLRVDTARNLLIIAGTQQQLRAFHELVAIFDVDWMSGMSFAMIPLDYAPAAMVIDELETIFGLADESPLEGLVRFLPIERVNAVLVIAKRPNFIADAEAWIDRLDQGEGQGTQRRLFVYYVKNGRSEDLASVLTDVFADLSGPPEARLAPGAERAVVGDAAPVSTVREAVAEAEGTAAPETSPVARLVNAVENETQGIGVVDESDIRIIADNVNNSLVILATPREYRMIEAALTKLDIVPLQVLIEATIAEVTLTDNLNYGVNWFLQEGQSGFHFSDVATGVASSAVFPGFTYLLTAGSNFRFALKALEEITDVKIISAPQLMVLDNHSAELQVGNDVPVATQQQQASATGDAPLVNTIEFRETGIILLVTPRVNPGGLVIMDIEQEVSSVTATGTTTVTPTIQTRRIVSSIAVQSGQTVALGGLIQDNRTQNKSGVPFLQSIPILGALFSSTSDNDTRTELLVAITPRVVGNQEEARAVAEELRNKMRAVIPLSRRVGDRAMPVPLTQ